MQSCDTAAMIESSSSVRSDGYTLGKDVRKMIFFSSNTARLPNYCGRCTVTYRVKTLRIYRGNNGVDLKMGFLNAQYQAA